MVGGCSTLDPSTWSSSDWWWKLLRNRPLVTVVFLQCAASSATACLIDFRFSLQPRQNEQLCVQVDVITFSWSPKGPFHHDHEEDTEQGRCNHTTLPHITIDSKSCWIKVSKLNNTLHINMTEQSWGVSEDNWSLSSILNKLNAFVRSMKIIYNGCLCSPVVAGGRWSC